MAQILSARTLVGTVVDVYKLRTTRNDSQVVDFKIAITPSERDESSDSGWRDGETEFVRCTAWNKRAANVAKSFKVGDRAIVIGTAKRRPERTSDDGETTYPAYDAVTADFVGLDLTYTAAHSERTANKQTTAQAEADGDDGGSSKPAAKSKSASKSKPAAKKPKPAPVEDTPDMDDDDLWDDDDFA